VAEVWLALAADQVVEGLDLAVMKHNEEETFEVSIDPEYGFGDREEKRALATVAPNSQLHYTVEILEIHKVRLLILWLCFPANRQPKETVVSCCAAFLPVYRPKSCTTRHM
jgi:hypothetical protein